MLFNSLHFLIFFPVVATLYFVIPYRFRWILLLIASYYFYMAWVPVYILLIVASTTIDYFSGILMGGAKTSRRRLIYLCMSLLGNLGILFFFKYANFFSASFQRASEYFGLAYQMPSADVLLPVGISFYTFQSLSYTIEVYRGRQKPERHPGIFALYISFFPQLVAGPIERPQHLLPQLKKHYDFDYVRIIDGLKLMAWGMFKKIVIADRLAQVVDTVYGDPTRSQGPVLVVSTVFFAFQIYCDFSGYSDIAIGAAQIMGINLIRNFNRPYFAKSVPEFWRRWHISLSTWFKDYLYISLGGNRVSVPRWYLNIVVVFLLSGLWHGANWTFAIWGLLHGLYVLSSRAFAKPTNFLIKLMNLDRSPGLLKFIQVLWTFLLVNIGWVFFRAENLPDALYVFSHIFSGWTALFNPVELKTAFMGFGITKVQFIICWFLIFGLLYIQLIQRQIRIRDYIAEKPLWVRWSFYYGIVVGLLLLGVFTENQFIYFQF